MGEFCAAGPEWEYEFNQAMRTQEWDKAFSVLSASVEQILMDEGVDRVPTKMHTKAQVPMPIKQASLPKGSAAKAPARFRTFLNRRRRVEQLRKEAWNKNLRRAVCSGIYQLKRVFHEWTRNYHCCIICFFCVLAICYKWLVSVLCSIASYFSRSGVTA